MQEIKYQNEVKLIVFLGVSLLNKPVINHFSFFEMSSMSLVVPACLFAVIIVVTTM